MALHVIEVGRVCVWSSDLTEMRPHHAALRKDIDEALAGGERKPVGFGEQTITNLHERSETHWKHFFSAVRSTVEAVVADSSAMLDRGRVYLRAWGLRLGQGGEYNEQMLRLSAIHNHSPAFLSSVYYLTIPSELATTGDGGTYFVNPFPHSLTSPHPGIVVPPAEGRLVVFPSWILHGPLLLDYSNTSSIRTIIATDAHYVPA